MLLNSQNSIKTIIHVSEKGDSLQIKKIIIEVKELFISFNIYINVLVCVFVQYRKLHVLNSRWHTGADWGKKLGPGGN